MYPWRVLLWAFLATVGKSQDLSMCLDSFDIHQDKIIRTQDSRAMGAKYINERDVSSREECLRLCCDTQDCDVFVYEEKVPGSCYLFQCGTPEDFKCKFTKHRNYTSAVLVLGRHLTELESQIKHTQHEHELARLRQPDSEAVSISVSEAPHTSATEVSGSKEAIPAVPTPSQFVQSRHCSRYQFECHGSGECIAIYNACDGIPQCADGSDEAPELGCPVQVSTMAPAPKAQPASSIQHTDQQQISSSNQQSFQQLPTSSQGDSAPMPVLGKQYSSNQWTPQMFENQRMTNAAAAGYGQPSSSSSNTPQQLSQQMPQSPPQLVNQVKQYGREGEGLLYHSQPQDILQQWQPSYNQEQIVGYRSGNSGGSQIFSHKGSGLVAQSDSVTGQFDAMQPDYSRYNSYYENGPSYHKVPQSWQSLHKPHGDMNNLAGVEENLNGNMNLPVGNMNAPVNSMPGQDYYYEESFRTRLQPQLLPQRLSPHNSMVMPPETPKIKPLQKGEAEVETQEMIAETEAKNDNSNSSVKKASAHHIETATSTEKPKAAETHHHHNSHRKVETLSAELSLTENSFDSDGEGQNMSPRGAILSLTMGLCVTGIMLVLVGCRMRMVRRRMRRGSKSPYAHDADFLVNGMYL